MSMSDSHTLFLSEREERETGPCLINQNQKDQHFQLERIETRGCTVDNSVGSAGEGTSCYYILCCIMNWHRRNPCCWQQLCFLCD